MEKLLGGDEHIVCFFFVLYCYGILIVAFLSELYLIGLNMAFRYLQNIYKENFWQQSLIRYLAKPHGQEVGWQFFIYLL